MRWKWHAVAEHLHLVATHEGEYGFSVVSPQLPSLAYGAGTEEELRAELPDVLEFAEAPALPRVEHFAERFTTPEGDEYTIRVAQDAHQGERLQVATILAASLTTDQRSNLLTSPRPVTGEVQFVCAVPTDSLRWLIEQLDGRGDAIVVAVRHNERSVWTTPLAHSVSSVVPSVSLDELGLTAASTVRDLKEATLKQDAPSDRRLVLV
jgi:hypothetical protein